MTADALAGLVRKGDILVRVEEALLTMEAQSVAGNGTLRIEHGEIIFRFYVAPGGQLPPSQSGTYGPGEFWKVKGMIEGVLPFTCDLVPPFGRRSSFRNTIRESASIELDLHSIGIPAFGVEALSTDERLASWPHGVKQRTLTGDTEPDAHYFEAQIADFPAVFQNATTEITTQHAFLGKGESSRWDTFMDQVRGFSFALTHEDDDLVVRMKSTASSHQTSPEEARRQFAALLHAIAIAHGKHAWPYHETYYYGAKKLSEKISAPREKTTAFYLPFDPALLEALPPDDIKHRAGSSIRLLAQFFFEHEALGEEITGLAFLFREAQDREVHHDIESLTICVLFESLVTLLFRHFCARQSQPEQLPSDFVDAKSRLLAFLMAQTDLTPVTVQRLKGRIEFTDEVRLQDKFKALCHSFGLKWTSDLCDCITAWKKLRPITAHGARLLEFDKDECRKRALICGAFYLLILKAAGFSGSIVLDHNRHLAI